MEDLAKSHPVWKRVWRWLYAGNRGNSSFGWLTELREPSPWSKPQQVWRAFLNSRRVFPTPLFYVFAIVVGCLVGLVLQFAFDLPWWISPIVCFVVAWLWTFTSIWWGYRGETSPLRQELTRILKPEQARAEMRQRDENLMRSTSLTFWRFESLTGVTPTVGISWGGEVVDEIVLQFVEGEPPFREEPRDHGSIVVHQREHGEDRVRSDAANEYMNALLRNIPLPTDSDDLQAYHRRTQEVMDHAMTEFETFTWQDSHLYVDGETVPAKELTVSGIVMRYGQCGGEWILISTPVERLRTFDATRLVTITDRDTVIEHTLAMYPA